MLVGNRDISWVWQLERSGEHDTRLVSRIRLRRGGLSPLAVVAMDVGDFVMLRQMLNGIRDRAEGRPFRSFASLTAEFLLWVLDPRASVLRRAASSRTGSGAPSPHPRSGASSR